MTSKGLLGSAPSKEALEKLINEYFFSKEYYIDESLKIKNDKLGRTLDKYYIKVTKNRWRFYRFVD
nr:MAG TPA: hypothetical protein [Caudoviricetes sp.]